MDENFSSALKLRQVFTRKRRFFGIPSKVAVPLGMFAFGSFFIIHPLVSIVFSGPLCVFLFRAYQRDPDFFDVFFDDLRRSDGRRLACENDDFFVLEEID